MPGYLELLPVTNGACNFKSTYLRAPAKLDDKMADLAFSARVVFFLKFLSKNIFSARRKLFFKIDTLELISQK